VAEKAADTARALGNDPLEGPRKVVLSLA
jgi:hypothetical protein